MRVQELRSRHLRSVPDREPSEAEQRYYADFERTVRAIHLFNGIGRAEREVGHLIEEANRDEREQTAACLENALAELRAAREGCK